ncbi:MAG: type II secretion system secretin GspD [Methylobacter sp.]|uniref:type II secretion system secretin GspD n=1 Tax=Methylobacter sp. TaxID=2051955 RepID=UPI002731A26F|nr:type II secretion system secretin GspD [Methylobacter sp.]MDP1664713.1 type II secretion system secretin GspD [Methylobacter sp.]
MTNVKKIITASCLVVVGLTLSSCESLAPKRAAKLPLTPVKKEQADVTIEQLQNKAPVTVATPTQPELFPGTNRFVPDTTTQHRKIKGRGEGEYSLNFDEADLGEVAKVILSDILGQNYVLSPKVAGKVTLQTTDPLSKEELIPTLEMLLRMNNAVLIKDASIYHIEPASEALYSSSFATPSTAGRAGFQVRVIPVRNVAVQNIVDVIKPLVQEKTILNVDSTRNMLIVSGTPDELGRVMDMVSTFDVDVLKGQSFGLFPLAHVEPDTIIKELEEVFSKDGKEGEDNFFRFIAVERLNAVMAITHRASYLKDIESWIFRLDRANTASGGGVNVYRVQHVDAEELASTLNEIFTGAAKKEKSAKVAPGQQAAELSNKAPEKQKVQKISGPTGDVEVADVGDVRIISDAANNSVVIVATPQDYEVILPVIKQLDVLPLQVLIDATIVSVALTGDLRYGISWYLSQGNDALASTSAPPGKVADILGTAAQAAAAAATGGFSAIYSSGSVKALLNAQATANNLNVISSPSLMVLNNQQAKINVGDQVPVQTSTTQLPISGGTEPSIAQSSSIQYIDTGVTLEVTPRVNANGMVIMEIKQIVSNAKPSTTGVTTTVTIAKKEIESSVAVHDGETIVLGGLIDDNNAEGNAGIPYLQDIPWIGSLFGGKTFTRAKTELVVLITPRVVKSKQDSRLISDEFKRKLTGIYESRPVVSTGSVIE